MRYWDNDFDRKFDEALDELAREERQLKAKEQEAFENANIGNPIALYGAI